MSKVNLADGYYRVPLSAPAALNLAVVLPSSRRCPLLALPLVLPMGWRDSPPYFCMVTETIADQTNNGSRPHVSEHSQEPAAAALDIPAFDQPFFSPLPPHLLAQRPLQYTDVYIDDFMLLCQLRSPAMALRRRLFHHIDTAFRPNTIEDLSRDPPRKTAISQKKLEAPVGMAC